MTRRIVLALVVVAGALVVAASSGFSTATADRGVDARVADDREAYLGITVEDTTGTAGGEAFTLVELADNFRADVDLDSASTAGSAPVTVMDATMDGPVKVRCTEPTAARGDGVTLTIEASGQGTTVIKHKRIAVTCAEPTPTPTPTPGTPPGTTARG